MQSLIHCSKCEMLPYDILMMTCNHNLCIKCAVDRLHSQTNKSIAGRVYIQCEKCKSKTNLDEESIEELNKVQKNKNYIQKIYIGKEGESRLQTPINTVRSQPKPQSQPKSKTQQSNPTAKKQPSRQVNSNLSQQITSSPNPNPSLTPTPSPNNPIKSTIDHKEGTGYGECQVHREEPIMYYCLTCKIHCFCAECVLAGEHQNHEVKVIRKAYAIVEAEFLQAISTTKKCIQQLLEQNRQVASNINSTKNQSDSIKRTIEKCFDQLRSLIRSKQLQVIKKIDQKLSKTVESNNLTMKKTIQSKLHDQKDVLNRLEGALKRGEKYALNFYADEWTRVQLLGKDQLVRVLPPREDFSGALMQYVAEMKTKIQNVDVKEFFH